MNYDIDKETGVMTNFKLIDLYEIPELLEIICDRYRIIYESKKPKDFVFDEDKSVKWNKEQVELFNKNMEDERAKARELRRISKANLDEAVVDYIIKSESSVDMSRAAAKCILDRAKIDHDDCWWLWISTYTELADLIIKTIGEQK